MLTRRQFLGMGAIGGVAAVLPWERALTAFAAGVTTPQFAVALSVPPVLAPTRTDATTDYYSIAMKTAKVGILPGKLTTVWAYNGLFPGPTIAARVNRKVVVHQTNNLTVPTTVHLHGGHVAPGDDGHPTDLIQPGKSKDYNYPNAQLGATLWYHDHTMHATSHNVYMGLAGLYLLRDDAETALNLPSGAYDIPVIVQDRSFKSDGSFAFSDSHSAELGNTILANGRPWPYLQVAARKYRFRFLNASNSREYELSLDSGKNLQQIASDGGLLTAPFSTPSIRLSPAERAEFVYDFSQHPVGTKIVLKNKQGSSTDGTDKIMRFDVVRTETDTSKLPASLRSIPKLTGAAITRDFTLSSRLGLWVINNQTFDPNRVDVKPKLGTTEIWRVTNSSGMAHPFHIHLVMFQVLDRDGTPPAKGEAGWKDTVRVDPGSTVRVIAKFTGYTGRYVYHCHNLAHEDHDMMAQMEVVP
jgi:FtsP/CotA-like multicopper oxidase with cupredoxin domain